MDTLDWFWHLSNFFAASLGVGAIASALAKLSWRRRLARVSWLRLLAWSAGCGALASMAGLVLGGRDGLMATYAAVIAASALGLWWAGFLRPR